MDTHCGEWVQLRAQLLCSPRSSGKAFAGVVLPGYWDTHPHPAIALIKTMWPKPPLTLPLLLHRRLGLPSPSHEPLWHKIWLLTAFLLAAGSSLTLHPWEVKTFTKPSLAC